MSSFPPPPVSTIDWSNVGFKVREVNGHIESTFRYSSGDNPTWSKPKFVRSPYLSIHGMAPGLNYGVQCYEGMKAFRQPDGNITIFRPDQNALRMQHSASYISVPPVPEALFVEAVNLAVSANAEFVPPHETGAAMYIRPLLFGSSAQLGLNPPDEYTFVVFVMPTGVYHGVHAVDALILEDFDRAAPEGTGSAKVGGNYAPVLRHSEKARGKGYGITLHLDSKTRSEIDEFSTSGFLGVRKDDDGKTTIVVPDSKNVIKSVTSVSATQIAKDLFGYNIETRPILYSELSQFSEVMAAGTAASLVPIKSITLESKGDKFDYPVNEALDPGPVCAQLLTTLKGIQQGKVKDTFGWNYRVTPVPEAFITEAKAVNGAVDSLP
ncbi:branched-chain amino acid aminotransferase [Exophiala mesophila]|uniref:Branched-chain amino acid aminotransferase n=1 Tax=Exophiala mesophila TaxID=212818 RepID=A0A0D1X0U1_EXOME|nr:branched-chain amino acid aminotransferase [Exophiala mesophila]KIV95400.1 branched-chain amino acid aminotransferase [Exophiala mesophila]